MTYKGIFEEAIQLEKLKKQLKDEKERRQFAENELALIKGIGNNSPEKKAVDARVKDLMKINQEHKKINGELRKDLDLAREDNQLLSIENGRLMKKLSN